MNTRKVQILIKRLTNTVINEDSTISVDFGEQEVEIPFTYDHETLTSINPNAVGLSLSSCY